MQISQKLAERLGLGGEKNFTFFAFCEDFVSVRPCYRLAELVKMAMVCEEEKKRVWKLSWRKRKKKIFTSAILIVWSGIKFHCKQRKVTGGLFAFTKKDTLILERVLLNNPVNGIIQNESGAIVTTVDGSKYEVS